MIREYQFVRSKSKVNFFAIVFFLSSFFPLAFSAGGSIFNFIEVIAPVAFMFLLFNILYEDRPLHLKSSQIHYAALIVLFIWSIISWFRYPLFGSTSGIADGNLGIKSYYRIIVGVFTFYICTWYIFYYIRGNYLIFFKILLYFSLVIGFIRIASFILNFDIPFLYGSFRYDPEATTIYGGLTIRLSGLDYAGYCGGFSLLALRHSKESPGPVLFAVLFITFIVFLILHAGRSTAISYLFSLSYYALFIEKISTKKVLAGLVLFLLLILSLNLLPRNILRGQLNRITAIEGGIKGQYADRRAVVFQTFINDFYDHPIFGRGIRPVEVKKINRNTIWIKQQLADGGHGSYHSLMGLFGIGGIFFISVFLFLTIVKLHFIINNKNTPNIEVYIFIMLFLLYKSLQYYAGGKGYNDYSLFLLVGSFVAMNAKQYRLVNIASD